MSKLIHCLQDDRILDIISMETGKVSHDFESAAFHPGLGHSFVFGVSDALVIVRGMVGRVDNGEMRSWKLVFFVLENFGGSFHTF
jgi:hypothetical protein